MRAFVFPGQGTQRVGMGERLYFAHEEARNVFDAAERLLGYDVAALCFRGDPDALTATQRAQPAIFVTNAAALAVLESWGVTPALTAGHSVGEISALHAAGVLSLGDALLVVQQRAEIMATVQSSGAMVAVHGLDEDEVDALCDGARAHGPVCIGLHNGPRNFVVSGATDAVEEVVGELRHRQAVRITQLRTQHAFHSPLMQDVVDPWREFVMTVPLAPPTIPVALNTTGRFARDTDDIRRALVDQIASTVRWYECVRSLVDAGAAQIVEAGDAKVLVALARGAYPGIPTVSMADPRARRRLADTQTRRGRTTVAVS